MPFSAGDKIMAPGLPNVQVFTSSGTWTKPSGLRAAMVEVLGGGGGGGGVNADATGECEGGCGGAGGFAKKLFQASELTSTVSVTVGALGAGGAVGQNNGATAGTSTFLTLSCGGGVGGNGAGSTSGTVINSGGAGGSASGGDLNVPGQAGVAGRVYSGKAALIAHGGNTIYGSGGGSRLVAGNGLQGQGYGAGGGGAYGYTDAIDRSGGNGAVGVVIITTYF